MTENEAIDQACADVGIEPPRTHGYGRWLKTDTLSGKNGKGDGRVIINDGFVTAWNWQSGEKSSVGMKDVLDLADRKKIFRRVEQANLKKQADAARAAIIAAKLVGSARPATHPYLVGKGFREEKALVVDVAAVRQIGGDYLVPDGDHRRAIVMPARIGSKITTVQLIWENGAKKFLFGGEVAGANHRIATGADTWLCEGLATGHSVRAALHGLKVRATVLCCFNAANIVAVARQLNGRVFIGADHDKAMEQFDGLGTGEHYAQAAGRPYTMPTAPETDFNDMHMKDGIFAVQSHLLSFLKRTPR